MTKLIYVKQTVSVKDYQRAFVSVITRINLSTQYSISIFLNNLKPELSNAVKIGNPCSLPQAYYLARLQEANFATQRKAIKGFSVGYLVFKGSPSQEFSGVAKGNMIGYKKSVTANFDNNRRGRLTPAEMDEKRAQCICFFCDEPFIPGYKCKAKR